MRTASIPVRVANTQRETGSARMTGASEIYRSSSGDVWTLVQDRDRLVVQHVGNPSSGGHVTETEIDAFLKQTGERPEAQALLRLIATRTESGITSVAQKSA
jgi:hypothetical protein